MMATEMMLLLPYGLTCLIAHMLLYITFRYLPFSFAAAPWKVSPSFTAHKMVAFCAMNHWCYLGLIHVWSFDYSNSNSNAGYYVPAGYEIAQIAMGALLCWDIPMSLTGSAGPIDTMMHLHHFGMVVVTACVLGGAVGTHVAPIFLGAIELSSIPLQVVDFFHPKKKFPLVQIRVVVDSIIAVLSESLFECKRSIQNSICCSFFGCTGFVFSIRSGNDRYTRFL